MVWCSAICPSVRYEETAYRLRERAFLKPLTDAAHHFFSPGEKNQKKHFCVKILIIKYLILNIATSLKKIYAMVSSMYCKVISFAVCLCCEFKNNRSGATTFFAMKTNLKLKIALLLGCLALASVSCGVSSAKPASGFDVSAWSPRVISIGPRISEGRETQASAGEASQSMPATGEPGQPAQQLSTDNQ